MSEPESGAPDPWADPKCGSGRPVPVRIGSAARHRAVQQTEDDAGRPAQAGGQVQSVRITGIDMPFWSLALTLLKLALAAVPALLLLLMLMFLLLSLAGFMLGTAIVSSLTGFFTEVMKSVPWF